MIYFSWPPVPLEALTIDLRDLEWRAEPDLPELFQSFDPRHVHVLSQPAHSFHSRIGGHLDLFDDKGDVEWPRLRLERITFTNSIVAGSLYHIPGYRYRSPLLDLVFDLSVTGPQDAVEGLEFALVCIRDGISQEEDKDDTDLAFGHVQVWVHANHEVDLAKTILVDYSCTSLDIGVKT